VIGDRFETGEAGEEVETLGGYLVTHVGRLPVRGEVISAPAISKSRCSTPIPGASNGCASPPQGTRRALPREPPPRRSAGALGQPQAGNASTRSGDGAGSQ
jgi:hypothetical protein